MINISFVPTNIEFAEATAKFLLQRPILRLLMSITRLTSMMMIIGFALCVYADAVTPKNIITTLMAFVWLFFYKQINTIVVKKTISGRDLSRIPYSFKIDKNRIMCKTQSSSSQVDWRNIKYVLSTYAGYIIPLTGIGNAGRFLWLPKRAFSDNSQEQEFIKLLEKVKKPIKKTR